MYLTRLCCFGDWHLKKGVSKLLLPPSVIQLRAMNSMVVLRRGKCSKCNCAKLTLMDVVSVVLLTLASRGLSQAEDWIYFLFA